MQMQTAISTICIVGFPPEALPRELKNLCRFLTGYEGAHVAFAGAGQSSALFVKFTTHDHARVAMEMLQGVPFDQDVPQVSLRVEFARREMEVRPNSLLPAPMVAPTPPLFNGNRAVARPVATAVLGQGQGLTPPLFPGRRVGLTGGELTTITVLGMREKGIAQEELKAWFQQRPGFLVLHVNERIDGLFIKFDTSTAAEQCLEDAKAMQLGAEWARRNLDDDVLPPGNPPAPVAPQLPVYQPPLYQAKRQRAVGGELNTITILGIREKELTAEMLQHWFSERPGFVAMQVNDRINGVFAKFSSSEAAQQVLEEANTLNWGAEWARRNLDL
eukprot:CAMPEP_0172718958 /NCGR_PEP_ID=MMETSP1074-20121228/75226_1 /TAXON_ID=2916 /ORGANISM="Ceratium fusus, Strain PA161109" /LENGTH=330 /DNA_ID=CAMNT_0013544259 /DNA_START=48 /DNA_END=1040 /DNA_ORIENTATION=+